MPSRSISRHWRFATLAGRLQRRGGRTTRLPAATIVFLVIVAGVTFFLASAVFGSPELIVSHFSTDDSFYYFQTAWQTTQSGFVTFDGIHATNGVHFLWFIILYALALVSPTKLVLLHAGYGAALLLVLVIYGLIWRAGTLLGDRSRVLTLMFGLVWTVVLAGKSNQMFVGMESTVQMAALWAAFVSFLQVTRQQGAGIAPPGASFLWLAASLVAIAWARVDGMLYSLAILGGVLVSYFRAFGVRQITRSRHIWIAAGIIGAGAAIQLGFYQATAGTILPISGLSKAASPHETSWEIFRSIIVMLSPIRDMNAAQSGLLSLVEASIFVLALSYVVRGSLRAEDELSGVFRFAALLGIGSLMFAVANGAHHEAFFRWYLSGVYMFYILAAASFLYRSCYPAHRLPGKMPALVYLVTTAMLLIAFSGFARSYSPTPLYAARYKLAHHLRTNTESGDVIASFNAGQLGYFSDRTVINLDGLVNDEYYLDNILNRPENFLHYLNKNQVKYIVDYDFYWASEIVATHTDVIYSYPARGHEKVDLMVRRLRD